MRSLVLISLCAVSASGCTIVPVKNTTVHRMGGTMTTVERPAILLYQSDDNQDRIQLRTRRNSIGLEFRKEF